MIEGFNQNTKSWWVLGDCHKQTNYFHMDGDNLYRTIFNNNMMLTMIGTGICIEV